MAELDLDGLQEEKRKKEVGMFFTIVYNRTGSLKKF